MEEEENYLDKPASAIGADILRNVNPTLATVGALGSTGALTQTFDPRLVDDAAEKQLIREVKLIYLILLIRGLLPGCYLLL